MSTTTNPRTPLKMDGTTIPQLRLPEISRGTIKALVSDMNRTGFGVLPGYLAPSVLEDLGRFVETAVADAGGEYVAFTGENAVAGTLLINLAGIYTSDKRYAEAENCARR